MKVKCSYNGKWEDFIWTFSKYPLTPMTQLADLVTTCRVGWYMGNGTQTQYLWGMHRNKPVPSSIETSSVKDYCISSFLFADLARICIVATNHCKHSSISCGMWWAHHLSSNSANSLWWGEVEWDKFDRVGRSVVAFYTTECFGIILRELVLVLVL